MAEEIILALFAFLIAGAFGWLGGVAIGNMLFGKSKIYSVEKRERRK